MTREEMEFLQTKLESIRDYLMGSKFAIRGLVVGQTSQTHAFTVWLYDDDELSQVVRFKIRGRRILMKCLATANFVETSHMRDVPWTGTHKELEVIVHAEMELVKKHLGVGNTA